MKTLAGLFFSLAGLVLSAAWFASAADLAWDQERVAALAQDLIEPLENLRTDLESRPSVPGKEVARATLMSDVDHLLSRGRELAQRLASGAGRAETVALFGQIEAHQSQAATHSREYPAPFDMHVYVDRVQEITIQLARYYGESSDSGGASGS